MSDCAATFPPAPMFTFVHAADLHLDSPFRALRADERSAALLREATFGAFARVVDLCLRERAAFLLLAGDLYDAKDRSVRARLALRRELGRLDAAGIRTFIVHGNHDPLAEDVRGIGLPASAHVFGPQWEEVKVERDGRVLCRVQGVSYPHEKVTENLSRHFRRTGPELTIGLLHANAGADASHANYAPCTLEELGARGLDYWALGHVHTRAEHALSNGGVAVYPGNSQGRHANETGERGCVAVTVHAGGLERRFVATDRVRWHRLEVDVSGLADPGALADRVQERADEVCASGFDAHAVRIVLQGRGPLHAELSSPEARAGAEEELAAALGARSPLVVLESLEVRTRPVLDLEALRSGGGLPAQLLDAAQKAKALPGGACAAWDEDELRGLDAKLARLGVKKTRESAAALAEGAVDRALELVVEEP